MTNNWLTYKDIQPMIEDLFNKHKSQDLVVYHIKKYDDVNYVVGKIIEACQISETEVKAFMGTLKIDRKSLSIKGIGDLIAHLCNKKVFSADETNLLRNSVKARNYISHHFYLEYKNKSIYSLKKIEKTLNGILYIIQQGSKLVALKRTLI